MRWEYRCWLEWRFFTQANLRTPSHPEFQCDLYCSWKYLRGEVESIDFSDDVAYLCRDRETHFILVGARSFLCTAIARRAYVLLATWFRSRGVVCCWGRVRFSSTSSTWWVCQQYFHLSVVVHWLYIKWTDFYYIEIFAVVLPFR